MTSGAGTGGAGTGRLYLGVDGGGTKTALALTDADGTVVAEARTDGSYYFSSSVAAITEVIAGGVREVCAGAGVRPDEVTFAFFGLPGYGESSIDQPDLDGIGEAVLGHRRYRCGNDMICGWAGSLGAVDGINVVSGTGSICYGERDGRGVRVGGWGEVFSDEGSAYWIGVRGLALASRMSDGRTPPGPLLDLFRDTLHLPTDLDLVDLVLNRWQGDRSKIAALSASVDRAARDGDDGAARILEHAGRELADLVTTTRRRLDWPAAEPVPTSYSGGTFASTLLRQSFVDRLQGSGEGAQYGLREPALSPHIGAALYAQRLDQATRSDPTQPEGNGDAG